MDFVMMHAYWTVVLVILFLGIWIWAWSGKRKAEFDKAARMALDDDEADSIQADVGEKKHG